MKTQIDVCTQDYVRSHMHEPRGTGTWAFAIDRAPDLIWTPSMTYRAARVWAKARVRDMQVQGAIPAAVPYITLRTQP